MKIEFSSHALKRLKKRGILQIYIEEELLHPIRVEKREGLIKIVTLYWI